MDGISDLQQYIDVDLSAIEKTFDQTLEALFVWLITKCVVPCCYGNAENDFARRSIKV